MLEDFEVGEIRDNDILNAFELSPFDGHDTISIPVHHFVKIVDRLVHPWREEADDRTVRFGFMPPGLQLIKLRAGEEPAGAEEEGIVNMRIAAPCVEPPQEFGIGMKIDRGFGKTIFD